MTLKTWIVLAAALPLMAAGCAAPKPPPVDLADVAAGLDAYKAGDAATLEQHMTAIAARTGAVRGTPPFTSCTKEGYALRRSERARRKLAYLDLGPAPGSAETLRYVYLEGLITGGEATGVEAVDGPTDFECESDPDYVSSHRADDDARYAVRDLVRDRVRDWYGDLHTRLGDQFEAQMNQAAAQLHNMRLRSADRWEEPNTIR